MKEQRINRTQLSDVCLDCTDFIPTGKVYCDSCPISILKVLLMEFKVDGEL